MSSPPPLLPVAERPDGPGTTLDFGKALQFFFEDPDWVKKLLIGGVFSLLGSVIIGSFFVAGFALRTLRRTMRGEARPLPDWDDWGGIFSDGLKVAAVYLGHLVVVLLIPGSIVFAAVMMTGGLADRRAGAALAPIFGVGIAAAYLLFFLLVIAISLYLPAALARLAVHDDIRSAFDVRENVAFIRRNLLNYGLTLLLYLIASFATQFGILLCCVGVFPVSFWAICVPAWALGETIRRDGAGAPASARPYR